MRVCSILSSMQTLVKGSADAALLEHPLTNVELRVRWKVNTYKCIDASPVLLSVTSGQHLKDCPELLPHSTSAIDNPLQGVSGVVYVGSHSHQFLAVEVESGRVLWRSVLGGRVESSACPSHCGKYIAIGQCDVCAMIPSG